jgi:rhomboid family GlyGly-CTERM serine protease
MHASKEPMNRHWPVFTLLLIGIALVVAIIPGLSGRLVYDRSAILTGEVWRMFTGHCVHFSVTHLIYNLIALGVVGLMAESRRLPGFRWLCLAGPWIISAGLLVLEPRMHVYGGLSGLVTALVVFVGLHGLRERSAWRWVCVAMLIGVAAKIVLEMRTGGMLFATTDNPSIAVATVSHMMGAVTAMILFLANEFLSKYLEKPSQFPKVVPRKNEISLVHRPKPTCARQSIGGCAENFSAAGPMSSQSRVY